MLAFLAHPSRIGAVLPTSRWAVRDMLDMADLRGADLVVELGPGTGVYTREILARLRPDARLIAIERDPTLARLLAEHHRDPRLQVVCDSAENAEQHLDGATAQVVVSGLPLTTLPAEVRDRIVEQMVTILAPGGTNLVLQYSTVLRGQLEAAFPHVRRRFTPWNVPPARLFACSMTDQRP
ncbi:MAG TPA: methyltransferase domain-containing protein [Microlunatus sp.]